MMKKKDFNVCFMLNDGGYNGRFIFEFVYTTEMC